MEPDLLQILRSRGTIQRLLNKLRTAIIGITDLSLYRTVHSGAHVGPNDGL